MTIFYYKIMYVMFTSNLQKKILKISDLKKKVIREHYSCKESNTKHFSTVLTVTIGTQFKKCELFPIEVCLCMFVLFC